MESFAAVDGAVRLGSYQPTLRGCSVDPNPDYDASDELEYFFNYFPWALRGIVGPGGGYPPPAYPPV
jgi:hypothetical protein